MPPIRNSRNRKPPPEGFEDIEDTLLEFSNKMKDAENAPSEGKRKHEALWPIFQISHQRECSRVFGHKFIFIITVANITISRITIYLRPLLRERGTVKKAI